MTFDKDFRKYIVCNVVIDSTVKINHSLFSCRVPLLPIQRTTCVTPSSILRGGTDKASKLSWSKSISGTNVEPENEKIFETLTNICLCSTNKSFSHGLLSRFGICHLSIWLFHNLTIWAFEYLSIWPFEFSSAACELWKLVAA